MKIYFKEDSVWLFTLSMEVSPVGIFKALEVCSLYFLTIMENIR